MPKLSSSIKSARQNLKRRLQNRSVKSAIRTDVKKLLEAIQSGKLEEAKKEYQRVSRKLDRAAARKLIHKNQAARQKSRLAQKLFAAEHAAPR